MEPVNPKESEVIEADFDPAYLPCQLLAEFWYALLAARKKAQ